jgi:hypothetical protein
MKRHVIQKFLGITILSLMLAVSSRASESTSPPLVDPSDTDTTDLADTNDPVSVDTNSPASRITNSLASRVSPVVVPSNITPSSPLGQVVRMLQSGVDESVILAYVYNSNVPFSLNSDQIIYLNDLGAPSDLVTTMIQHDQQLGIAVNPQPSPLPQETGTPPEIAGQPPGEMPLDEPPPPLDETNQPPDEGSFYGALAPYGAWVSLPGYGLCWQPCAGVYTPGWTPYCTQGQWVYSNCGWYWMSRYSWGWSTFHYGRWFCDQHRGWCWYPGTAWSPAWVCWRNSGNYCGWAPLPPHCNFVQGKGLVLNGTVTPANSNFGLNAKQFTFVPIRNLTMAHPDRFRLASAQASSVFNQAKVANDVNVNNLTFINQGVPAKQVASAMGRSVQMYNIQPVNGVALNGWRGEQVQADGQTLVVTRPNFNAHAPATLNQGIRPALAEPQHITRPAPLVVYPNHPAGYNRQDNYTYQYPGNPKGQVTRVMGPGTQAPSGMNTSGRTAWSVPLTPAPNYDYNGSRYLSPRLEGQVPAQTPQPYQQGGSSQTYQGTVETAEPSRAGSYVPNNSGYIAPATPTYSAPAGRVYSTPGIPTYPAPSGSFGVARGH